MAGIFQAAAQQKDIFDADQYLQKKRFDKKSKEFQIPPATLFQIHKGRNYQNTFRAIQNNIFYHTGNMPCIRPDMRQFKTMPNLADNIAVWDFRKKGPGVIPNPAYSVFFIAGK